MSKPSCEFLFHVFVSKSEGPMVDTFPLGLTQVSPFDGSCRSVAEWALEHLVDLHPDLLSKCFAIDLSNGHLWEAYGRGRITQSHGADGFYDTDGCTESFEVIECHTHDLGPLPEVDIDDL